MEEHPVEAEAGVKKVGLYDTASVLTGSRRRNPTELYFAEYKVGVFNRSNTEPEPVLNDDGEVIEVKKKQKKRKKEKKPPVEKKKKEKKEKKKKKVVPEPPPKWIWIKPPEVVCRCSHCLEAETEPTTPSPCLALEDDPAPFELVDEEGSARTRRWVQKKTTFVSKPKTEKEEVWARVARQEAAARGRAYRNERRSLRMRRNDEDEDVPEEMDDWCARLRLRFGNSKIHTWGVFADEPLRKDELLMEYRGELIGNAKVEKRALEYETNGIVDYMFRIDDRSTCDATVRGSLCRFVNHSCGPNCYTKIVTHAKRKKIALYAKRDIEPGEELSYDYKFAIEEVKIPCHCMAPNCRGSLN